MLNTNAKGISTLSFYLLRNLREYPRERDANQLVIDTKGSAVDVEGFAECVVIHVAVVHGK